MIDSGVPPRDKWPEGVFDSLAGWEQGDLVAQPPFLYFADPSVPIWEPTRAYTEDSASPEVILPTDPYLPPYGVVTTQTCDIAEEDSGRPIRPWVQLAPVYRVTTWKRKKLEGEKGPGYWLLVPDIPEDGVWVADFRIEIPVEKGWLAAQGRVQGFADEEAKRGVARRLVSQRGRPAFSRELNAVHENLFTALRSLDAEQSDLAEKLFDRLEEVVVQVDSHLAPTSAQLVFLTSASLPDDCREWLEQWRDGVAESAAASGLALHALDFRALESVSLLEYRRMTRIW
jgi:hypothetical protein